LVTQLPRDLDRITTQHRQHRATLRAGEVFGLRPEDLDLERGTALVRRTWSRQRLGPTKTSRERVVSLLHPVADDTLDWWPGAGDAGSVLIALRQLRVLPMDPTAFLFTRHGAAGGRPRYSCRSTLVGCLRTPTWRSDKHPRPPRSQWAAAGSL